MRRLDLTLDTHAANLALDEALLEEAEEGASTSETLRLWEAPRPVVVLGRSSRMADEARVDECRRRGVPILRRASGGAAIVAGPGCLMYAVVLSYAVRRELRPLAAAHEHVMNTLGRALSRRGQEVAFQGTCDLTLAGRKFSGNSMRVKREHFLYHGTILYDFPLELIEACLASPPRVPEYRRGREHGEFVTNLPLSRAELCASLIKAWNADEPLETWPRERVDRLVAERYSQDDWNLRH